MLAIIPRLAAAFNRSTLLTDPDQPDGENPAGGVNQAGPVASASPALLTVTVGS